MAKSQEKNDSYVRLPYFGLAKLYPYVKKYGKMIFSLVLLGFIGSLVDIIFPLFQSYAINVFITQETLHGLLWFILAYLGFILLQVVANAVSTYQACAVEMYINRDMRRVCFNHLQTLGISYYAQNSVGYIHSRLMSDTGRIGALCAWTSYDAIYHFAYIIGSVSVMLSLNAWLALLVIVLIPVAVLLGTFFQKKYVAYNRKVREKNSVISGNFNEGITGAKTIKTLVIGERTNREFCQDTSEMYRLSVKANRLHSLFMSVVVFLSMFSLALVLWRGGIITQEGVIVVGTLSVFMSYAQGLMEPVQWLISAVSSLVNAQVNIERFTRLMETKSDVTDSPEVIEKYGDAFSPKKENWEKVEGEVTFRDVSFRYPDGDEYVLEHFNLHVPKGAQIAIVGETGAGKSTLVNLVCRFYEPTEGQVLLDGKDLRERSQLWLHSNIGYVLQTPHLFSGTILENIRYGKPDATEEEVIAAAKAVSADGFIRKLKDGYRTEVGEGGDMLSTGEKQLISFARVLIANPAIYILDEVTSSVDTVTEQIIQETVSELIRGKTTFMIAHRLSTVRNADVILAVRNGKIVERGTHAELMQKQGYYYELYMCQFEEDRVARSFDREETE